MTVDTYKKETCAFCDDALAVTSSVEGLLVPEVLHLFGFVAYEILAGMSLVPSPALATERRSIRVGACWTLSLRYDFAFFGRGTRVGENGGCRSYFRSETLQNDTRGAVKEMLATRFDAVRKIKQQKQAEIDQMIKYVKEEDPETCINILFVLSQSRSDD